MIEVQALRGRAVGAGWMEERVSSPGGPKPQGIARRRGGQIVLDVAGLGEATKIR